MRAWSPLDPAEAVVLTFNLGTDTALASGETLATPAVSFAVRKGEDADPDALIDGSPQVLGPLVLWKKRADAGVPGADYTVRLEVDTSAGQHLVVVGLLVIRTKTP